jgi:putative transposase
MCDASGNMARHTTFKFCLDPTVEQQKALARHAGAARFAFNQCLRMVKTGLSQRRIDRTAKVPWTGFDLINEFNAWKKSEDAGRVFVVDPDGVSEVLVTGLIWRDQVYQQVFEEAAVDCGRGLSAWSDGRSGGRKGRRVGFPRFRKKTGDKPSFRLRNKHPKGGNSLIRVGETHPRSVRLPGIGTVRVHDDTRRLRRMLATGRAKILFATVSRHAGRWWVALNVEAADLHRDHRHPARAHDDHDGWIGVDRGLSAFVVAATTDGREVARIDDAPKPLADGIIRQRRLAKSLARKEKGSNNRRREAARLARHHYRVRNIRRHFLHGVSNDLIKTHDRLVIEGLHVAGMVRNRRLARAISDAGWAELGRQLLYKAGWRGGEVLIVERWYPSSQICSRCSTRNHSLTLADRTFACGCGHRLDRDHNAAVNLARWGKDFHTATPDPQAGGRVTMPADGPVLADSPRESVKPVRVTQEPTFKPPWRSEPKTPEKGGAAQQPRLFGTL